MQPVRADGTGLIRVLEGIKPVLVTDKATIVEFRDKFDDLMALFFLHFTNDTWVFVHKGDEDWESHLIRLGYLKSGMSAEELLQGGLRT